MNSPTVIILVLIIILIYFSNAIGEDYSMIIFMILASTGVAYYLMTIAIDLNITANKLKLYSSILMGLTMGIIECISVMIFMPRSNKIAIIIIILVLIVLSGITYRAIRKQIGIDAKEFLLAMIEHHQMAISMASRLLSSTSINENLRNLASNIISSQEKEIEQMKDLLI